MTSSTIQTKITKTGQHIYYSLAQKESESAIGFNLRLFVMVQDKYFGYIREKDFVKKDIDGTLDLNKIKKKVMLKDIRRILNINKNITFMINELDKNGKLTSLKWVFRFENEKLAESWVELLDRSGSPNPSRKTTEHKERERDKERQEGIGKGPSIREIVRDVEVAGKSREESKANRQKDKQKEKQQQKIKQDKQKQLKMSLSQKPIQPTHPLQLPNNQSPQKRQSQLTFSFKGQQSQDNDPYSPPKKQSQIILPHPVLQKIKKMQSNLSAHLEQKVDFGLVEKEISMIKGSNKSGAKEGKGQFKQLSQNLTNREKQLQNVNFTNYFREVVGYINDKKYQNFYNFCQLKARQLFLQNFTNETSMKSWLEYISQKNGIKLEILLTQLKQIPGNSNICDQGLLKSYLNMIKNADYIWKIVSRDEILCEIFVMPMTCIVEFQGVLMYFCCNFNSMPENMGDRERGQDFSRYFQRLSDETKISKAVLENSSCIKFTKFNGNKFIISEVRQYLPRLLSTNCQIRPQMFVSITESSSPDQKPQKFNPNPVSTPSSTNPNPNSLSLTSSPTRSSRKHQQQQSRYFKQPIQTSLHNLAHNLNRLQEYIVHPSEFSKLMHMYGLNMAHIGELQRLVENAYMKGVIKTEAALRVWKVVYRKKMQEILLEQGQRGGEGDGAESHIAKVTKTLLNVLLGKRQQSQKLWQLITLHSQISYKLPITKQQLNKGYLFLGLQHHLSLRLETNYSSCSQIFTTDSFLASVLPMAKLSPCQLYWLDQHIYSLPLGESVNRLMSELGLKERQVPFFVYQDKGILGRLWDIVSLWYGPNAAEVRHLGLYRECEGSWEHTLGYFRRKISEIKWLIKLHSENSMGQAQSGGAGMISSDSNNSNPNSNPNTNSNKNSLFILSIQQKLQKLKQPLLFYFGQYHPFYTEFFDIAISLFQHFESPRYPSPNTQSQIESLLKQSLTNILQLCGGNTMHLKLSNSYYQRGQFYENWGRIEEAIGCYKKCKNILEYNEYTRGKEYAVVEMRLAGLYFVRERDGEVGKIGEGCFGIFCELVGIGGIGARDRRYPEVNASFNANLSKNKAGGRSVKVLSPSITQQSQSEIYTHLTTCLDLLSRCSQTSLPDKSSTLLSHSLTILQHCLEPQYPLHPVQLPDALTIKLLKIIFENYFAINWEKIGKEFFSYVEECCDQVNAGGSKVADPTISLNLIKELIINNKFVETLENFDTKAKALTMENKNNVKIMQQMRNKKLETFGMLVKGLIVVLGEGFVLGVLNEQYK